MPRVSRRVRAFLRAEAVWQKLATGVQALSRGIALGCMDHRHIAEIDEIYFAADLRLGQEDGVPYGDEEYICSGLFDWEERAIRRHFPSTGTVVLTAAGGGRELVWLVENGYEVFAYESNAGLREAGNAVLAKRGIAARLMPCERDVFPPDAPACDAVIIGWGSYTLIAGAHRRRQHLEDARARLRPGGPVLVSYWHRPRLTGALAASFASARLVRWLRRAEGVDLGDFLHPQYVHYVSDGEMRETLSRCGFEPVELNGQPYGHAVGLAVTGSP